MSNETKSCTRCGAGLPAAGNLESSGRLRFRPDGVQFFTLRTADVSVAAQMCPACGDISLRGDVNKLDALLGRPTRTERVRTKAG